VDATLSGLSIFAPAQPIYVARPIVVGRLDRVPTRCGLWPGNRDAITPPEITPNIIPIAENARKKPGVLSFAAPAPISKRCDVRGYEAHRARIGDHESADGFHAPVKAAVAAYIARYGSSVNTEWLRADLERAIREAPQDPGKHDDAYVEFRIHDLDTLIPAVTGLQRAKEAGRRHFAECEPTYPAPLGTVEEARELLVRVFDDHVRAAAAYADAAATYAADLEEWEARQAA